MHELYYDFHIHSCLSPCGDEDMTPGNIVGMAKVKGLDVIALTDHNSCKNCPAVMKFAEEYNIIAIPGMELTTYEEVHLLCLFVTLKDAMEFDEYVYKRIEPIMNKESIFGRQIVRNEQDEECQKVDKLLITRTSISCYELSNLMTTFHGVIVPAHVDKLANSLLSNLGFAPKELIFHSFEISQKSNLKELEKMHPDFSHLQCLYNSDAHYLGQIQEPLHKIAVTHRSMEGIINNLK